MIYDINLEFVKKLANGKLTNNSEMLRFCYSLTYIGCWCWQIRFSQVRFKGDNLFL